MLIKPIQQSFGSSRVMVDKSHPKAVQKLIKSYPELSILGEKRDVYFRFAPSLKSASKTVMTMFKRGIDHVADIPEYAIEHQTGDQVYIYWEKDLYEEELPIQGNAIVQKVKKILDFTD